MSDVIESSVSTASWEVPLRVRLLAYLELSKARIAGLVLLTTFIGLQLGSQAAGVSLSIPLLLHAIIATAMVVAGANALNQVIELEHDRKMVRTQRRPLPSGRLQPYEALTFGLMISAMGLAHLAVWTNFLAGFWATIALISYVLVYTPLKRVTSGCVLVGAIPGALPPIIGWAATGTALTLEAWLLFGIMFFWQLPHFAAIAWQYRDDYARAGYPMLSVVDNGMRLNLHVVTHTVALLVISLLPATYGYAGKTYAIGAFVLGLGFLATGIVFLARRTRESARLQVLASIIYLPILLLLLVLDAA